MVAAQKAGLPVTLVDTSQASIDKGLKFAGMTLLPDIRGLAGAEHILCRQVVSQRCLERTYYARAVR